MDGPIVGADRTTACQQTFDTPFLVVDDFLPLDLATAIRGDIETYFAVPNPKNTEMHQVWNYRYMPGLCAYLRTSPGRVVRQNGMRRFSDALGSWSGEALGLRTISWPVLSLYVAGCHQTLHSDSANGRIGYIYSLTNDTRRTQGGQTLVFNDGDPVRANFHASPNEGSFCTAIEPAFNRLVLFDTRMPHGVEPLMGSMDPLEGRFDLHGYISESVPIVEGALAAEEALSTVGEVVNEVFSAKPDFMNAYHGPLCLRIDIEGAGSVLEVRPLLNRVVSRHPNEEDFGPILATLLRRIAKEVFPKAPGKTKIFLPIMFGGFLPFVAAGKSEP